MSRATPGVRGRSSWVLSRSMSEGWGMPRSVHWSTNDWSASSMVSSRFASITSCGCPCACSPNLVHRLAPGRAESKGWSICVRAPATDVGEIVLAIARVEGGDLGEGVEGGEGVHIL